MTARELLTALEACDLDKEVTILISIAGETENGYAVIMREIVEVTEKEEFVIIQ